MILNFCTSLRQNDVRDCSRFVRRDLNRILLIRRERLPCSELETQHSTEASLGRSLSLLSWPDLVGGSERSVVSTAPWLNERQVR